MKDDSHLLFKDWLETGGSELEVLIVLDYIRTTIAIYSMHAKDQVSFSALIHSNTW